MGLQSFTEKTVEALKEYFGTDVEVNIHKVYKNNGILLQGVCVLEKGKNIAPTVYLNDYFQKYGEGASFGEIIRNIICIMENNQLQSNLDMKFFEDYESVRKKLVLRLIHREKNKDLLEQIPHLEFQDLAIVCHCIMVTEEIGNGSILIHKHHLEAWGVERETLFQDAFENSPQIEPHCILKMSDMMKTILRDSVQEQICDGDLANQEEILDCTLEKMAEEIEEQHIPMYILTNTSRYYGAACMVYPDMLEQMGDMLEEDFYILPSSVHEVIFLGATECVDSAVLNEMIQEVNLTQVAQEEWLSNHAYLYQRKNQKLISITN